jgi:hypothetical protein
VQEQEPRIAALQPPVGRFPANERKLSAYIN